MVLDLVPPAVIVLTAALLVWILPRDVGHAIGVAATLGVAAISWFVPDGAHVTVTLFGSADVGFRAVLYNVDVFSRLMGLIFGFIGATAVLYSWASDADSTQTAFALTYVGSSLGAVYAGDWLTLIFCWELMAVTSTLLVWHYGGAAVRAGFRYAVLHGIGGSLLLAAIIWYLTDPAVVAAADGNPLVFSSHVDGAVEGGMLAADSVVPAILAAVGIGVNVGFVGLHTWLPDTYPRPHVAASVFLCVYTTKTGVYGMYRAFPDGHRTAHVRDPEVAVGERAVHPVDAGFGGVNTEEHRCGDVGPRVGVRQPGVQADEADVDADAQRRENRRHRRVGGEHAAGDGAVDVPAEHERTDARSRCHPGVGDVPDDRRKQEAPADPVNNGVPEASPDRRAAVVPHQKRAGGGH